MVEFVGENCISSINSIMTSTLSQYKNSFFYTNDPKTTDTQLKIAFDLRPLYAPENSKTCVVVIEPTFKDLYGKIITKLFYDAKNY